MIFSYGPISLPYPLTTQFSQEAVADDSDTDRVYSKFDIIVQALINGNYAGSLVNSILPGRVITNPADIMDLIRSTMMTRRQKLSAVCNGVDLIPRIPTTAESGTYKGYVDAKNGPIPISCTINSLNNTTYLITFHIVAHYWEKNQINANSPFVTNLPGNSVLSNRWMETVEIDQRNFSKKTREGKYIIASNNPAAWTADQARETMAFLGIPRGCVRSGANYTVSPDGLALQFRISDTEVYKQPPEGAFEAQGFYMESAPQRGPIRFVEAHVTLKGDKTSDQSRLITTAVGVVTSKIAVNARYINPGDQVNALPQSCGLKVDMYDNVVEFQMRAMVRANRERIGNVNLGRFGSSRLTFTPLSDSVPNQFPPAHRIRGTAGFLLHAARYYDPSITTTSINGATNQLSTGVEPGQAGVRGG